MSCGVDSASGGAYGRNHALKAERDILAQRVVKLEEELALARLHRFAQRSERHMDRVFNEAEQSALRERDEGCEETDCVDLQNTGLQTIERPEGKKRGRRPCQRTCHVSASSIPLLTTRRSVRAAATDASHG